MATTGFWPVKSRLKEVIDYAENPDKTIERKYLDDDLAAALEYAENDSKTDRRMYVTGINCLTERAFEQMTASKRRYGKLGGNVAYHGFQSFRAGEVTPKEAHKIGLETVRKMWGSDYEIVVTTHLNTGNIHNHMKTNIEECLKYSRTTYDFEARLVSLGYEFKRSSSQYAHVSVIAKGWKRPIRLGSLGYINVVLNTRFDQHLSEESFFMLQNEHPRYRPKQLPLLQMEKQLEKEIEYSHNTAIVAGG